MKLIRSIFLLVIFGSFLTGCVHPVVVQVTESSERISSLAMTAKGNLEECLMKKDKKENNMNACDDVDSNLNEIINITNDLPDLVKKRL